MPLWTNTIVIDDSMNTGARYVILTIGDEVQQVSARSVVDLVQCFEDHPTLPKFIKLKAIMDMVWQLQVQGAWFTQNLIEHDSQGTRDGVCVDLGRRW